MIRQDESRAARLLPSASLLLAALLVLCGCGSAAHSAASAAATARTCQQVSSALSDGPDPDADPVGYAEAQILPLRQIAAPDKALLDAIRALAGAYQNFFASNGASSTAKEEVAVASKKVNSFCPGAES
jgi:hypothetical protein